MRTTDIRPMLVTDVMGVMLRRRAHATPLRQWVLESRLPRGMYGSLDALRGAAERGLLTVDDSLPGRRGRAVLITPAGLAWDVPEGTDPAPLLYTWRTATGQVSGTLKRWAFDWLEQDPQALATGAMGRSVGTERHPGAFIPYIRDQGRYWSVVAAGEQALIERGLPCRTP